MTTHASGSDSYDTVIVGAGIVGSALAAFLSEDEDSGRILLIDRSISQVLGSTAYAPGFLGQFNESPVLTRLAVESLGEYENFPDIFCRAGGLELARTKDGVRMLEERCEKARGAGLQARMLEKEEVEGAVPEFVSRESFTRALYFATDGVADPEKLCLAFRQKARERGVQMLEAEVEGLEIIEGVVRGVRTDGDRILKGQRVILATGIWTSLLTQSALDIHVPVVPVAHPYVYTPEKDRSPQMPFCRWPEDHVYARDHGDCYGIGSYDHSPMLVHSPGTTGSEPWTNADFAPVIEKAVKAKIAVDAELFKLTDLNSSAGLKKVNGVFSVTPDNLPLLGRVPGAKGLWLAAAIWITHAAGSARLLARVMRGEEDDGEMARALDPARFGDGNKKGLEALALRQYNDIYRSELAE